MHVWPWVVTAIVILYVLGQWLMLRPTPQEQHRMKLREAAKDLGFQVRLRKAPDWLVGAPIVVAYYALASERVGLLPRRDWRTAQGDWLGIPPGVAPENPDWSAWRDRLLGWERDQHAVIFFWTEHANVQDLPALKRLGLAVLQL
ncbi:MAG: hypothetical protein HKM02_11500 [Pseudomonadales bacterium]|nr:hypothetical protein [Pseudomonadales bacterium]